MSIMQNLKTFLFPADAPSRGRLFVRPRWDGDDGMRHLLRVGLPLVMSSALHSLNQFFDRTFLAWYSQDSFTAALQAGVTFWAVMALFHFTVIYAGTFIAQFHGAKQNDQIGATLWQGVYLAIAGSFIIACCAPLGRWLFTAIGHEGNLPELESAYFEVFCWCGFALLLNWAAQNFFNGLGRTGMVLFVNGVAVVLNICLNTWMIFEPIWIFPDGIAGAAWASVISMFVGFLIFVVLILANPDHEKVYRIRSSWRYDGERIRRILRFGFPSGVHAMMDVLGITSFFLVVGLFGYQAQYASNLALNANFLLWMPAIGVHAACQILAGQLCGAKNHGGVERLAAGAATITLVYMGLSLIVYLVIPEIVLNFFRGGLPEEAWQEALGLAKVLLVFVAVFTMTDGLLLVYSGVLKGAGDTKFVMWVTVIFSQVIITGPCILMGIYREPLRESGWGLYLAWGALTVYIIFIALLSLGRFMSGHWKSIDVIDQDGPPRIDDEHVPPPPADEIRTLAAGV